ncbi:hypothetical protein ACO0LB_17920 [Undibacterium sp. SXout7W]|uniref:hypothetical protein n=1 Tax=Undibacterium sp. SXout7W TaxID=3413049 RepID=UPI003BF33D1A
MEINFVTVILLVLPLVGAFCILLGKITYATTTFFFASLILFVQVLGSVSSGPGDLIVSAVFLFQSISLQIKPGLKQILVVKRS